MYVLVELVAARFQWFNDKYVPVAMAGALIPDAVKVSMFLPPPRVEAVLDVSFSWFPLSTLVGSIALAGLMSLLITAAHRQKVFIILVAGITSHVFLDALIIKPGPTTPPKLYPLTFWEPPMIGFYISSDFWPWVIMSLLALLVFITGRVGVQPADIEN